MAAGGFKEFVAGEVLDQDEINDFLMQGVLVFAGTAARGSAITSPVEGQFSFLADSDSVEFWDGSAWVELSSGPPEFQSLIIGGGGGGGGDVAGGGGGGGYRSSVTGENSGGSAVAEPVTFVPSGSYTVTVGGGGTPGTNGIGSGQGTNGSPSRFSNIFSLGGGGGGGKDGPKDGLSGGCGGAATGGDNAQGVVPGVAGLGFTDQGFAGGTGRYVDADGAGGGGGGAGAIGANGTNSGGGNGGAGVSSSITGSAVGRGGGGGGGVDERGGGNVKGTGTDGGGNGGDTSASPTAGTVNTGGGGGGGKLDATGANGGSGVVILKYPSSITLTIGVGLTSSTTTSGLFKITSFTAGTDVISF